MTQERIEEYQKELKKAMPGIKDNPHNYPIIKKWNNKIFRKNSRKAFAVIEKVFKEELDNVLDREVDDRFNALLHLDQEANIAIGKE